jgi:hypothetical protein
MGSDRVLTVIPRTTPSDRAMRNPGSSKVVVVCTDGDHIIDASLNSLA